MNAESNAAVTTAGKMPLGFAGTERRKAGFKLVKRITALNAL